MVPGNTRDQGRIVPAVWAGISPATAGGGLQTGDYYRRLQRAGVQPLARRADGRQHYVIVGDGDDGECFWQDLWQRRAVPGMQTAFSAVAVPQCALLSAEAATAIVAPEGLQAPPRSAWVGMRVHLPRFLRPDGELDQPELERALVTCVDTGDALHDVLCWPSADAQHDAWLNRRLAIVVSGLGDILELTRRAPESHASLRFLGQLLQWLRMTLRSHSQAIARRRDLLPAIALSDPSQSLPPGCVGDEWRRCWQRAAEASRVAHRNLLVMSPWSLFPTHAAADFRYAELLPLLRHADACTFRRPISISHWNVSEFKHFHKRAMAVLRQRIAASLIAEHV